MEMRRYHFICPFFFNSPDFDAALAFGNHLFGGVEVVFCQGFYFVVVAPFFEFVEGEYTVLFVSLCEEAGECVVPHVVGLPAVPESFAVPSEAMKEVYFVERLAGVWVEEQVVRTFFRDNFWSLVFDPVVEGFVDFAGDGEVRQMDCPPSLFLGFVPGECVTLEVDTADAHLDDLTGTWTCDISEMADVVLHQAPHRVWVELTVDVPVDDFFRWEYDFRLYFFGFRPGVFVFYAEKPE